MDGESYDPLAGIVGTGLLGAAGDLDPGLLDHCWSGEISVPSAIDSDSASYLSQHDSEALERASAWIARNHVISGYMSQHHLSLVRWLFENGHVDRIGLLSLLALLSLGPLDEAGLEIALLSKDTLDEGRLGYCVEVLSRGAVESTNAGSQVRFLFPATVGCNEKPRPRSGLFVWPARLPVGPRPWTSSSPYNRPRRSPAPVHPHGGFPSCPLLQSPMFRWSTTVSSARR